MKKILLAVLLGMGVLYTVHAQKGLLLSQSFDDATVPPSGWVIDVHSSNWSAASTNMAGGEAPEAKFHWSPQFNGTSRLISPVVDLTGISNLRIQFKHQIDHYGGTMEVGFATTSDGGSTWNIVWSQTGQNITEHIDTEINNSDVGQSNFQFCFYFDGDSYNINDWWVDDIILYAPEQTDIAMSALTMPNYFEASDVEISGVINNLGIDPLTSIDITWQVDDGDMHTTSLSGLSVNTGDAYSFTCTDLYTATAGDHVVATWISNVNGAGSDDDLTNDTISKTIHVASQTVANKPLFEEFTSSTCGPCASFNSGTFDPFLTQHEGEYTLIKYQMSWPGSGDPYYTDEGGVRRNYYGVSYVPDLYTGGQQTETNSSGLNTAFNYELNKPAFMEIEANHQIDSINQVIDVTANITPYLSGDNFTAHIVVVENMTTGNVASNGETEFYNVMMKMIPDANGTPVAFTDGTTEALTFDDADLSGTNIEEWSDLSVVVLVQNEADKSIFQSAYSTEGTAFTATFNPTDGATDVALDANITISFNQAVRMIDDSEITDSDIPSFVLLQDAGTDIPYTGTINTDKTEITITPDENLPPLTEITLTVEAEIENTEDVPFEETSISFTTTDDDGVAENQMMDIYCFPNPAKDMLKIKQNGYANVKIYNLMGSLVLEQEINNNTTINISALEAGNYIVTISSNDKEYKKLISILK